MGYRVRIQVQLFPKCRLRACFLGSHKKFEVFGAFAGFTGTCSIEVDRIFSQCSSCLTLELAS